MKSHELLSEIFKKSNPKEISAQLNLSMSLIYKWAQPAKGSGTINPLDRIESLIKCSNDTQIIQWICQKAGGFFIKNPKKPSQEAESLVPATNQIIQQFADMLSSIAGSAHDNVISKSETRDIRSRWEELKSVTEGFVFCCEEGNFEELERRVKRAAEVA